MEIVTLIQQAQLAGLSITADDDDPDTLVVRGPHRGEPLALALCARKWEVLAWLARDENPVAWRVKAFLAVLPATGPIWPPKLRQTPLTDAPGQCSLCGYTLDPAASPARRCRSCVRALWIALNMQREGVENGVETQSMVYSS